MKVILDYNDGFWYNDDNVDDYDKIMMMINLMKMAFMLNITY